MKTGIQVHDAMTERPVFLGQKATLEECAVAMEKHHVGTIIVQEDKDVIGIVSEQDIIRKVLAKGKNPQPVLIEEIMTTKLITTTPDKDIFEALVTMRDANIRHLPVVDGNKILGLLTLKDILKIEPQLFELLIDQIKLKEEEHKPINIHSGTEGICELCGDYTKNIRIKEGSKACPDCLEDL